MTKIVKQNHMQSILFEINYIIPVEPVN